MLMRIIVYIFAHITIFLFLISSNSFAEDNIFKCEPIYASVKLKNGKYYFESIDDENTPLIDQLTISKFLIDDKDVFYKNNDHRKFEQLISTKHLSNLDLNNDESSIFNEIWHIFMEWDQMLKINNYKTFIYPYKTFKENGDYDLSMKRISIHKENYRTSEITVPITEDRPSYYIERSCEGEKKKIPIQYFFEETNNRKLS